MTDETVTTLITDFLNLIGAIVNALTTNAGTLVQIAILVFVVTALSAVLAAGVGLIGTIFSIGRRR
jgi:hypothetical protein